MQNNIVLIIRQSLLSSEIERDAYALKRKALVAKEKTSLWKFFRKRHLEGAVHNIKAKIQEKIQVNANF